MAVENHQIARSFFAALSSGQVPDELLAENFTAWTTTGGTSERGRYQGGVKLLGSLFPQGLQYAIDSLTAEGERVAAEVHANGTLTSGEQFKNRYVFILTIRNGQIVTVAEHFNPDPVREQLVPLISAAMAKAAPKED